MGVDQGRIHTAKTSSCLVTAKKSAFSDDAAAFSDAQKTCAPRHSHSHDKFVFSDTAKSRRSVTPQRLVTIRKYVHPGIHTATTSPCLVSRQKSRRLVTLQRLVSLRKDGHPGIHTATTRPCLVIRRNIQRSVTLQRLVTLRKHVYPGIHTATTSPCLVTRRNSQRSATLQSLVTLRKYVHRDIRSHDKTVFSDTAKTSAFSDVAAFSDTQNTCTPLYSHSHDKSRCSVTR